MEMGTNSSGIKNSKEVHLNLHNSINSQKGRALVGRLETDKNLNKGINYCYDCGRIGHEARNCKFQLDNSDENVTEERVGNGLGTPHVKTLEEALLGTDAASFRRNQEQSQITANDLLRAENSGNSRGKPEDFIIVQNKGEIRIKELPTISASTNPVTQISPQQLNHRKISGEKIESSQNHDPITQDLDHEACSDSKPLQPPPYRVEFPAHEDDHSTSIIPFGGLSLIATVTTGLNRMHLKRQQEPEEEDSSLNPTKKRLLLLEAPPVPMPAKANNKVKTTGPPHGNIRSLKNALRSKKGKCTNQRVELSPEANPHKLNSLEAKNHDCSQFPSVVSILLQPTDGFHQTAISSP
ncbi:hypothetical protein K1719_015441 [Acacia pycnantha]|nr:hypothetical protein K1719_015441 [Acacia pycnantha]